jgi:hypothetical protein
MKLNLFKMNKTTHAFVWVVLLLLCSCKLPTRTNTNTKNKFSIVSNTNGKIRRIIVSSKGPSDSSYVYVREIKIALPEAEILAIHKTIVINNSFSLSPCDVLKNYLGNEYYNIILQKYNANIPCDTKTFISDSLSEEFTNDISHYVSLYTKEKLNKSLSSWEKDNIKIITKIDFNEDVPELDFWVQDQFHALQKFTHKDSIKFVYSTIEKVYINSVKRILDSLPFIRTDTTNYSEFAGGNFLPFDNYLLIGKNTIHSNYTQNSTNTLRNYTKVFDFSIKKLFGLPQNANIIHAGFDKAKEIPGKYGEGAKHQPLMHIDLFITPAGKVDDKNLILYGYIYEDAYSKNYLNTGKPYLNNVRLNIIRDFNTLIKETIDSIAITHQEFIFDTIPLVLKFGNNLTDTNFIQRHPSFNNAIVEVTNESKTVILSDYNDSSYVNINLLKEIAKRKYEQYKFNVKFVGPPADELYKGGIHCYTKVIWRDSL